MGIYYCRLVSPALIDSLRPGESFDSLVEESKSRDIADLQFRGYPDKTECRATLYAGTTKVLVLFERKGRFRLYAHKTHREAGFHAQWEQWQPRKELEDNWQEVSAYVTKALDNYRLCREPLGESELSKLVPTLPPRERRPHDID